MDYPVLVEFNNIRQILCLLILGMEQWGRVSCDAHFVFPLRELPAGNCSWLRPWAFVLVCHHFIPALLQSRWVWDVGMSPWTSGDLDWHVTKVILAVCCYTCCMCPAASQKQNL